MTTADRPLDHEFASMGLDLDPYYDWLREHEPVARVRLSDGREAWLVTRWDDVRRVLSDPVFSRAAAAGRAAGVRRRGTYLIDMDPPEHTRVRRHALAAFTNRRVQRLQPRVQGIVQDLLDRMEEDGDPADLVRGLSLPLPLTVICELLGVPDLDQEEFGNWASAFLSVSAYTREQVADAQRNLDAYLGDLIARRRREPRDDLLSGLVQIRDEQAGLSEEELVNLGVGLLIAGFETTASQLTNSTYVLLKHPEHWKRLLVRPDLIPAAVEELLRLVPLGSDNGRPRVATRDVELGGVLIRAGEVVLAARPVANRDEAVFEDSTRLDFDRAEIPHVSFGHGIHHCLGAHLARLELQTALSGLLLRFPRLRLAVPDADLRWKQGLAVRGLYELPVRWEET